MAKKQPHPLTAHEFLGGPSDILDADVDAPPEAPDSATLACILVHDAMTAAHRRMLLATDGLALVVRVPSADWGDAVADAVRAQASFQDVLVRSGASRSTDKPEVGNDRIAGRLALGYRVCGISHDPERYLPATLVAGADIRLDLAQPSPEQVARAIRHVTGEEPDAVPPLHGLGYHDFVAALRQGATAAACVDRLRSASAARSILDPSLPEVPLLWDLPGLEGEARTWSLALARDFQEYSQGLIPFSALDRCAVFAGEAGTGKTLLCRSIARTLGVPLIATSVSAWFNDSQGYLGDVVRQIDSVFSAASAVAPAVLYLDEADGLPSRDRLDSRNRDFWKPIIGQCLLKLDSATSGASARLIVVAATNHPQDLDPALVRPGRLNRVITVCRPSVEGIRDIVRHHLAPDELPGVDLTGMSTLGLGATGADCAAWVKAARRTARVAGRPMELADLVELVAPPDVRSPAELLACARHEIAHACAVEALSVGEILTVTIVQFGETSGLTRTRLANRNTMSRAQLDNYVIATLCGRASDETFGEATSGSGGPSDSDLGLATSALAAAHASLGLGGSLLHQAPDAEAVHALRWSPDLRRAVEADLRRLYGLAQNFLETHRLVIDALAHRLVDARILTGAEVRAHLAEAAPGRGSPRLQGGRRG